MTRALDHRPALVVVSGPNGAGKTTFYHSHLAPAGLRLVNADTIARALNLDPYGAAEVAASVRRELLRQRESFVFETVFSDPVGEKLAFIKEAEQAGYATVLCFIGISGPRVSERRVAMRLSQGGHDVPPDKLVSRFPRILVNLRAALRELPHVRIYDNDDLRVPFRSVVTVEKGRVVELHRPIPKWLRPLLPED